MITTIILMLSFLVTFNFLLLIFSCNKTPKKGSRNTAKVIRNEEPILVSNQLNTHQLAPTGS